jgi:eukaryotic-like serine/threonine-protein kinase
VRRLGAGGAGEVFEVRHLHLPRTLALKVLHADRALTATAMMRFRREARILATLEHPNIVRVVDFDFFQGRPFIVMEFVEGRELGALIEPNRGLERSAVLSVVGQLCSALSEMHARSIVHRDLKPQNIIVRADGDELVAKIVDFGLSRGTQGGTILTASQAVMGTPLYMSPEQAEGRNDEIDVHSDQFALGAICYELVTGRAAFRADTLAGTVLKVVNDEPPPMNAGAIGISPSLEAVIRRAMEKKTGKRHPSVDEFWRAFSESWSRDAPARTAAPATRRVWLAASVLGLVGASVLAVRAPRSGATRSAAPSSPARQPTVVALPPPPQPQETPDAGAPGPPPAPAAKGPPASKRKAPRLFEHL